MLETLLSSRVRTKVLKSLVLSPQRGYNAHQLSIDIHENYSAVWKELVRLEKAGILNSTVKSNAKEYELNPDCPIASELRSIVLKTAGIGTLVQSSLQKAEGVKALFIFGSFAAGSADQLSDLDLMVIGQVDLENFSQIIAQLETETGRAVNYIIFTESEWIDKKEKQDAFIDHILEAPKIMLIGDENEL